MSAPTAQQIWDWLGQVADPEIPAISIVELGIVRAVEPDADGAWVVTITPTYSGCPAMRAIAAAVTDALQARGVARVRLVSRLAPAWSTDWISASGRRKLREYGIAPPAQQAVDISALGAGLRRHAVPAPQVACPRCGSVNTAVVSQFGSTPCKALYQCGDCREPFDYFKCH